MLYSGIIKNTIKMKKQTLNKQFQRMQKLAGIITENQNKPTQIITPKQKKEFLDRINFLIEDEGFEYAFNEAGNILARVLTDDEAEWIEDIEEFGYNPETIENLAQELINTLKN
jgi:hypothetical protein